jgi:Hint domain
VRANIESGNAKSVAIVGATAADTRDTCVEGSSGILAISPGWNRPVYEPLKRRLTWPNGAWATMYSSEEADRLRGPNHDLAWCFCAGTQIAVPDGSVAIEIIRPGDLVMTRSGARAVRLYGVRFAEVGRVRFSNGVELVGTADHPIFTPSGLIRLSDLKIGDFVNSAVSVVSTWEAVGRDTVYNLQVADTPEYFANGILVVTSWRAGQINSKHGTI